MRRFPSFNPRAPCGARQYYTTLYQRDYPVSIHAPRAGRDKVIHHFSAGDDSFNPRAPCGARHAGALPNPKRKWFQSTRPVRGATRLCSRSRTHNDMFQSTRPVRGATKTVVLRYVTPFVSIHAPRAGRDHFYLLVVALYKVFQSTRPVRGATYFWPALAHLGEVSIHAPRAGRDAVNNYAAAWNTGFNPRAPCGARPGIAAAGSLIGGVSIHAPRAGRDTLAWSFAYPSSAFQSTRPVRGATPQL